MSIRFLPRNGGAISAAAGLRRVHEGALLLDVRRSGEWREGHAADAVHIPLDELEDRMGSLPKQRPVVVLCWNGARSRVGAHVMAQAGHHTCWVRGGLPAWAAAGGRVSVGGPAVKGSTGERGRTRASHARHHDVREPER